MSKVTISLEVDSDNLEYIAMIIYLSRRADISSNIGLYKDVLSSILEDERCCDILSDSDKEYILSIL